MSLSWWREFASKWPVIRPQSAAPVHAIHGLRKAGLDIVGLRTSASAKPEVKTQP